MNFTITPANSADPALCAQWMSLSDPWLTLGLNRARCERALTRPGADLFVARNIELQLPLGFILLAPNGFASSPYIASVGVSPDARSHGIGSSLLEFAEQHFANHRRIFLLVSSFNLRAQSLYRRHGYTQAGEIPDYIAQGYSELILMKRISRIGENVR